MIDMYTKRGISGLCIDQLRDLKVELRLIGMGGFSVFDLFVALDDYKDVLESDVLLIGCNLDGVRAVYTQCEKRFTFIFLSGDWILESIEDTDDSSCDGLVLNDLQSSYANIELLGILDILEGRTSSEQEVQVA